MKTCRYCSILLSIAGALTLVLVEFFTPDSSRAALLVSPAVLLVALAGFVGAGRAILTPRSGSVAQLCAGCSGFLLLLYLSLLFAASTEAREHTGYMFALGGAFLLVASGGFSLRYWKRGYQV